MLFYGSCKCMTIPQNVIVFNITSLNESIPKLKLLTPPGNIGYLDGRDFDIAYYNYIFSYDNVFFEFFQIIYNLYIGNDVYLAMIDGIDWSENLMESLLKVIQQRYGYNAYRIEYPQDYQNALNHRSDFDPTFGLVNLDADKMRYTMMISPKPHSVHDNFNSGYRGNMYIDNDDTPPWD